MKWLRIVPFICVLPVHADVETLDELTTIPQEHSLWCWAAVSSVAISAFEQVDGLVHLPQLDVVARRRLRITTLAKEGEPGMAQLIVDEKKTCTVSPELCDQGDEPLLFDIDSDPPPSGKALSMDAFRMEIKDRKRPVIIRWMYSLPGVSGPDAIFGTHALIVTGYDSDKNLLRVYDPAPLSKSLGSTPVSNATPPRHTFWIPISQYHDPFVQEGIQVCPMHGGDQFRMRRAGREGDAPEVDDYPYVDATNPCPPGPLPGGFTPPRKLANIIKDYVSKQSKEGGFLDQNGEPRVGLRPGKAFAVVAPGAARLLDSRGTPPASLLVRQAHAYVVPLLQGDEVVDSFQLLPEKGSWKQGGYSNAEIANLFLQLSKNDHKQLDKKKKTTEFYLVSVPELASFYIAHGFGDRAQLKPLSYGESGKEYRPANEVLGELVQRIRGVEKRARAAPRDSNANRTQTND